MIEQSAHFIDYNGNEQYATIRFNDGLFLWIDTYNRNGNHTGYMRIYFQPNHRFYLDVIYCYDEFRRAGIAQFISDLADYILGNYLGYVIRGVYDPKQLSTDRINKIERHEQELDINARKFYAKAGYEIIQYEEYLSNKDKYQYLTIEDFFRGEGGPTTIVAKPIMYKNHSFYEEDGIIYHNGYHKTQERHM